MRLKDQLMFVGMLILALSFAVCAQDRQVIDQKSITCKMDFFEAPTLPITGGIQVSPSSGTKWLTLQIFYTPALSYEAGSGKRLRWLDDLSVSAHIIAPAKKEYGGSVLLSGTQVLWSVAEDGQTHQVFFAVPPQIFRRYCELNKFSRSVAQSFPDAWHAAGDKIKILYGVEGYFINNVDDRIAVHGRGDCGLDDEFVCFDI